MKAFISRLQFALHGWVHFFRTETNGRIQAVIAMLVIAAGLAAWWGRERLTWLTKRLSWLADWAAAGFGFETLNRWIVERVRGAACDLAILQTGQLNWNLVGTVAGLLAVLAWLAWVIY